MLLRLCVSVDLIRTYFLIFLILSLQLPKRSTCGELPCFSAMSFVIMNERFPSEPLRPWTSSSPGLAKLSSPIVSVSFKSFILFRDCSWTSFGYCVELDIFSCRLLPLLEKTDTSADGGLAVPIRILLGRTGMLSWLLCTNLDCTSEDGNFLWGRWRLLSMVRSSRRLPYIGTSNSSSPFKLMQLYRRFVMSN